MKERFISLSISRTSFCEAIDDCLESAKARKPAYACFANVHMVVEAYDDPEMQKAVNSADFAFADGMPVASGLTLLSGNSQERIAGMDFIEPFLQKMSNNRLSLCIFGGGELTQAKAKEQIRNQFPGISEVHFICPPFRPWSEDEERNWVAEIQACQAHVVFVILGCPRQEKFMWKYSAQISSLMLGLGGALPTFLGIHKRAPDWMRKAMLEWLYRLIQEPARLWKRYTYTNGKFVFLFLWTLLSSETKTR